MDPREDLLTVEDVAKIRHTTPDAIYAARARGALPPASKFGRRLFWKRADIAAWIEDAREADPA